MRKLIFIFLLFALPAFPQGFRIGDNAPITSSLTTPGQISTVTSAIINVCASPANAVPCTNKATTYTSVTLGTPCATSIQVVLSGTNSCVGTTDIRGNWGAWVAAGNYDWTVTVSTGQSFGPFTVSAGVPAGTNLSLGSLTTTGPNNLSGGGALAGSYTHSGTETFNGPLNSNNLTAGNVANKPASADAVRFVSATGNDANDGLSMGTAKATIAGAYSTLPNCTVAPGFYNGVTIASITAPCGTVYLAENPTGYSLSSTFTSNGEMVRFVGMGMTPVVINCTTTTCISVNNQSPYANPGIAALYPTDGGFYNVNLVGNGSASQVGITAVTASWLRLHDVIFSNFNGTSANCLTMANDSVSGGYTEETDFNVVTFTNCTNGVLLTTTGGTPQPSFGHNAWHHIHFILQNGQTAFSLSGNAAWYDGVLDGVFNGGDANAAHTATAFKISGTAVFKGQTFLPVDNGGGLVITFCTGCTATNFQIFGYIGNVPPGLATQDNLLEINQTAFNAQTGLCFFFNGALKSCLSQDGSFNVGFSNGVGANNLAIGTVPGAGISFNGSGSGAAQVVPAAAAGGTQTIPNGTGNFVLDTLAQALTNKTLNTPLSNGTALQFFNTTTTCTTGATVGAICTTAAITLPVAEADTAYRVTCTGKGVTNVPVVIAATNSSATQFTITIAALTAAAATFASYDCTVGHN